MRAVLCIAHPGHELAVLHWMALHRPAVLILTDGSGSKRSSRLESSRTLIQSVGATAGPIFGRYTDRDLYRLILEADLEALVALAREIAEFLKKTEADLIAGDMMEGFNTGHDLCRLLIQAAVCWLERAQGRRIGNYEFPLENLQANFPGKQRAVTLSLTEEQIAQKRRRVRDEYPELAGEVDRIVSEAGPAAISSEVLYDAGVEVDPEWQFPVPPFYERVGAKRVAVGDYEQVITHASHMRPIALALRDWSQGCASS